MAVYKLVMVPGLTDDQRISPKQAEAIIQGLREQQFLSDRELVVDCITRYLLGEACMSQLTFLGCSPFIELDPPADDPEQAARQGKFCHLTINQSEAPVWRVDPTAKPRCPSCRTAVRQQEMLIGDELVCPRCGEITSAESWQWRSLAGRGSFFLDIWGVFTSEAVPNPPLLETLKQITDADWSYFYVKD